MYIDPLTSEEFEPKRTNQKFANRANQIKYNNLIAKKKREVLKPHITALEKNRNIIKGILDSDKFNTVSKDYLLGAGFNFLYFTQSCRVGNKVFHCIFDYGICPKEGGNYELTKLQE